MKKNEHESQNTPGIAGPRRALQCLFLDRLNRLIDVRAQSHADWSTEDMRLLEHAIYSTYQDCEQLGLETIAEAVLELGLT